MTTDNTGSNLSPSAQFRLRRAAFKTAHVPVDANGKPTGPPTEFLYDESGRLIEAKPAKPAEDA